MPRHEAHNQNKKKKRVRGVVDRVENGIVVVVVIHPDNPDATIEVYVPIEKFKKRAPKIGDRVTVTINNR